MKKTILKYRYSIITLLLFIANAVAATASTPWGVNPNDFQYDMSLYFEISFEEEKTDYSQYDVAVFCGEECRGVAEILSLGNETEIYYLRARSNKESGETMTFKYHNNETGEVEDINVSFEFESNGRLGYPSAPFKIDLSVSYNVILKSGVGGTIDHNGGKIAPNTELTVTATPAEGYHFEKWSDGVVDNPRTIVVNCDTLLTAEFKANCYKLTYKIDGNIYKEYDINYCDSIIPIVAPTKAGYTFSGWDSIPTTMPAHDITINGTFIADYINWTFDEATGTLTISGSGAMTDYEFGTTPWYEVQESIKMVIIEDRVTSIGQAAFANSYVISSITIPNSVTTIGEAAFAHCYGLTGITIPNSVTNIGEDAFRYCSNLTSIVINEGNSVYDSRENCNAIIKTSTNELIQGCKNTIIPNSVTTIGEHAFSLCNDLTSITIPNSVTTIREYAFSNCSDLTSITIPNSVTTIGEAAFVQCEGLTSVTIPNSITTIGFQAFASCISIVNITSYIPIDGLFPISVHTFGEVDKDSCTLYVPAGAKATYAATDGWKEFTNIVEINPEISISVDSISTAPGRSVTLPVGMANSEAVTAFQIDVEVPEGVEFVSVVLSDERKTSSHTISTSVLANNKRRIIAYSTKNSPFKLNEGTLLNINLDVAKEIENGDYKINISNIRMVMPNSNEILLDPISANINVKLLMGDANDDNDVTMGDVVSVANYILELLFGAFNFDAADINGDGEITMGDLVAIINIILYPEDYDYGRNAKRGVMAASGSALSMPDTRSTDEAVSVPVSLSSTMAYTAFQMDIELPEGAKLTSATASERAAGHSVAWSCLPDGKMRVVAYSLDNEVFSGNAGELVALNIEAEGAVSGAISVENVRMVTATGDEYAIGNCGSLLDINGTTGIDATDGNSLKVYTAGGALIVESGKAMKVAVYSVNGKLVKTLEVAEGKNVFEGMPAGTYVVAGVKVAIK